MRFSTRQLLLVVFLIAIVLAGLLYLRRSFAPNPDSERFIVQGSHYLPNWQPCQWKHLPSTLVQNQQVFESEGGYNGTGEPGRAELFQWQYQDHFGNDTFQVNCSVYGQHNRDWSEFILLPDLTGGGNTGASTEITTHFDHENMELRFSIYQGFNVTQEAKSCQLTFIRDGDWFMLHDNEHQPELIPASVPQPESDSL